MVHGQRKHIKSDLSIVSLKHGVKAETKIEINTFFSTFLLKPWKMTGKWEFIPWPFFRGLAYS